MGKGHKYGPDRLLHPVIHVAAADHLPDLDEADIWSVPSPAAMDLSQHVPRPEPDRESLSRVSRRWTGGPSLAFEATESTTSAVQQPTGQHYVASSAPVSVPEWPGRSSSTEHVNGSVESDRDDGEWVPPHEYMARSRRAVVATSVLEGVGRTLKGRDMSRVRDAVWSKTGLFG